MERARSKSRDPQKERERSRSRVRQGHPIAAAGLDTTAVVELDEKDQANKNEKQDEEKAKTVRKERRETWREARSRSRSAPFEGYHTFDFDSGLVEYGDLPGYSADGQDYIMPEETLSLKAKAPKQKLDARADQKYLPCELQDPMYDKSLSPAAAQYTALSEHRPPAPLFYDTTEVSRPEVSSSTISPEAQLALHNDDPAMPRSTRPSAGQTSIPSSDLLGSLNEPPPDSVTSLSDTVMRRRARNTIAARKSRQRRMEHMEKLEEEVSRLSMEIELWKTRAIERSHETSEGQVMQDYGGSVYNEGEIRKAHIAGDRSDWADDDEANAASHYQASERDQGQAGEKELAELLELWTMGYKYAQTQVDQHMKPH